MTHEAKVLAALQTGPQTAAALYRLGVMTHSRVSHLRKAGHNITCTRIPGETGARSYLYTLVSSPPLNTATPEPSSLRTPDTSGVAVLSEQLQLLGDERYRARRSGVAA